MTPSFGTMTTHKNIPQNNRNLSYKLDKIQTIEIQKDVNIQPMHELK